MNIFFNFWSFLDLKKKLLFYLIIFFSFIVTFLELLGISAVIPFAAFLLNPDALIQFEIISKFVDLSFLKKDNKDLIYIFGGIFFLIFLVKNLMIIFTLRFIYYFIFNFRSEIYSDLLSKILHQDYLFFAKNGLSKILNILMSQIDNYSLNVVRPIITIISELLVFFGIIILIFYLNLINGLLLILPLIVIIGLILKQINKSIKFWSNERIVNNENLISMNYNFINGIKELFLFGKIQELQNKQSKTFKKLENIDIKNNTITALPKAMLEQSMVLVFIFILIYMISLGEKYDDIIIILSFYLAAAYRLVPSFNKIFISYQGLKFGKPSYAHIMKYYNLNKKNYYLNDNDKIKFNSNIEIKNISFHYKDDVKIFEKLNFKIRKNQTIGILGESGSGKSTFITLLTCLIKPLKGQIFVDGQEIKSLEEIRKYQNLFSISSQDSFLPVDTIKENIIFGSNGEISEKRLKETIKFARLENFIDKIPNGINADIGTNIKELSSGQKQRISIARSIYSDREILIFDEATNALDMENEKLIFENLKNFKTKKTIIIISHNPDNLKICDSIFRIENKNLVNN
tara:strand:- start:196 stop:1917 length:1722 start_codon:yes stop_codon:yes gene_type:complete